MTKVVEVVENVEHREMGEQQECQDKLEQKALQYSRANKVHVVSMDNSDPSVYRNESCICCMLFLYDQYTTSTALQPTKGIQTEQIKKLICAHENDVWVCQACARFVLQSVCYNSANTD